MMQAHLLRFVAALWLAVLAPLGLAGAGAAWAQASAQAMPTTPAMQPAQPIQSFHPTHASMGQLNLSREQPVYELAANLRRAFSGIVAGNVKEQGINVIRNHGPFQIKGDPDIMHLMDNLLKTFVEQNRMKLGGKTYNPCYQIIHG